MTTETIKVPDLGGAASVEVIEVCVAAGDDIAVDDSIVVLESDKASMEVPSPKAGKVKAVKVSEGTSVSEGDVLIEIESTSADTDADAESEADAKPEAAQPQAENDAAPADEGGARTQADSAPTPKNSGDGGSAGKSVIPVNIPDLGGPDEVSVIEVCVKAGDEIAEGDSLIVLESDKASMEVPSPAAGKVVSVTIKEGGQASAGDEILTLETTAAGDSAAAPAEDDARKDKAAGEPSPDATASEPAKPQSTDDEIPSPSFAASKAGAAKSIGDGVEDSPRSVYAGPAVRKLAREMGVPLAEVKASGPRGRTTKDDLKGYVKNRLAGPSAATGGSGIPPVPAVDFAKFGEVVVEPLSKIHKVTLESMHRSWLNVPHVTQFDEVDITDLEEFRQSLKGEAEQRGVKMTPLPFLLKACAAALRAQPKFNASLHADGESMVYKQYVHIGMAVDTPVGLVVPVLRDVDKKSLWELAEESAALAKKAKDRKLSPAEMQGGCFTISSLGSIGGQGFTPIVNTPEVAILGVSKLSVKPVWDGSEFVPRKLLPLSLSYDHRAINGADAGRFFTYLNELLADIRRLAL